MASNKVQPPACFGKWTCICCAELYEKLALGAVKFSEERRTIYEIQVLRFKENHFPGKLIRGTNNVVL